MSDDDGPTARPTILFVCTGNAARSVMGAAVLRTLTDGFTVTSAGTHSIPGLPMSTRTRSALESVGAADPDHRSTQADETNTRPAALIAIFEPMHLTWFRRELPALAARVGSLPRLARDLAAGPAATLSERVAALELADHEFEPWEEVVDPAGGQLPEFEQAAHQIHALTTTLAGRLCTESVFRS